MLPSLIVIVIVVIVNVVSLSEFVLGKVPFSHHLLNVIF